MTADWADQNVQQSGARTQQRRDGVRMPLQNWRSGSVPTVADSGSAASSDMTDSLREYDSMSLGTLRPTFPPGKRRQSCIGATSVNKTTPESERSGGQRDDGKTNSVSKVIVSDEIDARQAVTSKPVAAEQQHSSSFDLGMTQPGTLTSWRRSSDKAAFGSSPRASRRREIVSYTSGEGTFNSLTLIVFNVH